MRHLLAAALVATLAGCQEQTAEVQALEPLALRDQLIRLSMDLRGVRPTEQELFAFEHAEPMAIDDAYRNAAETWIQDPRFVGRMKEIFNQSLLFRTGEVYYPTDDIDGLRGIDERVMADVIASEPLNLLQLVIDNDLPYSTMVTAPYTMANEELALYWGIDYPADAEGWVQAQYADGRPHAGVLTMSTTWARYPSMGGNANRHRANAISKMFLCDDYLSRPIVLNRAAVDQLTIDPENAISQNTGCQSCHSSLDPIAANFFGFFNVEQPDGIEASYYHPENEQEWRYYSGKEPGFYGRPTGNIAEFGQALAEDTRFADCAVQTVWQGLTQRDYQDADWPEVEPHEVVFSDADQNIKELVLSIVNSDAYKARGARDPELDARLAGQKLVSPEQLSSLVRDVTGYTWYFDGRDGLKDGSMGLPVLAGGIDSTLVTERAYTPTVGLGYIQERLATAAAYYVAEHDLDPAREGEAKLFLYVTVQDTPDSNPAAFEEQIRHLYTAVTGHPLAADAKEPAQLVQTWRYLYSVEASPTSAWAGVLSAILRDPQVLFY